MKTVEVTLRNCGNAFMKESNVTKQTFTIFEKRQKKNEKMMGTKIIFGTSSDLTRRQDFGPEETLIVRDGRIQIQCEKIEF